MLPTSAAAGTCALRAWSFAGRWCAARAWTCSWETWPRSKSRACAKSRPCARRCRAAGTSKSARPGACGVFGAWATGIRAGRRWSAREALSRSCWSACRSAIEDRFSALQPGPCRGSRWRNNGCLINRPWPRLRHHHAARNRHNDFRCPGCGFGVDRRNRTRHSHCGSLSIRRRSGLRCRSRRCFSNWRSSSRWLNSNLFVSCSWSRRRFDNRTSWRRRNHNNRARGYSSCGSFSNNCACGRTRCDGRSSRRRSDDRCRRARLRNNLAWFRPGGRCSRCRGNRSCGSRRGSHCNFGRRRDSRLRRDPRLPRIFFLFLLFGQQGLHHIAGFGDV